MRCLNGFDIMTSYLWSQLKNYLWSQLRNIFRIPKLKVLV